MSHLFCVVSSSVVSNRDRCVTQRFAVPDRIDDRQERLIYADTGVSIGEVGDIAVSIWREAVTRQRFQLQATTVAGVVKRAPGACGFICVVEADCRPPEEDMRRASIDMLNTHGGKLPAVACVIEGDGFRAAMTRSVLAGMSMVMGSRQTKVHFVSSVPQAAAWLQTTMKLGQAATISSAVERLRGKMPSPVTRAARL